MPSLTPLHETYCRWDRRPPSQADVLEGLAQLTTTSLSGVHEIVQYVHREMVLKAFGLSDEQSKKFQRGPRIQKLYQFSYQALQKYGDYFLAPSLRQIVETFPTLHEMSLTPSLHYLVGALNGVLGDYCLKHQNPLALPTILYDHYGEEHHGEVKGHVVILVHGLCMNHLTWSHRNYGGIGEKLLAQRDHNTILYLNYNTGRRISANGRSFANLLNDLVSRNPEISKISLIGHSMGGLVSRSALFYGKQELHHWLDLVENLICIGSPHHGAVLERMGFVLQDNLGKLPFLNRLGKLANIRSNGILDLRHGSVRDDDWEHMQARIGVMDDNRKPAPLPSKIKTFLIAGTIENQHTQSKTLAAIGDYLVSVRSALGEHPNSRYQLKVPESRKAVFYGLNHFEIQYHSSVCEQVVKWFYPVNEHEPDIRVNEYIKEVDLENIF